MQDWFLADNGNFMVSFTLDAVKFLLIYRHLQNTYWFKRGSRTVTRPTLWGLRIARYSWTSNAEAHADMYWYTFSQGSCPCIADAKPRKKNAYIHIPQTSTVAMPMTISWSCEVPECQEQSAVNALNMLRLSPPALTAGLHRPFGVGLHFRSGVPGFRLRTAYGCRLRTDGKFMIYFP